MKINGSLKDLVRAGENKRNQLAPAPSTKTHARAGRKPDKEEGVVYVKTALELPEDLKNEIDRMFLDHKQELGGKNRFMVNAIRDAVRRFRDKDKNQ